MAEATTTIFSACECGGDHRGTESRGCPIFEIINCLQKKIEEFLDLQQVLEFGKNGPMAHCLRYTIALKLFDIKRLFIEYEDVSEKHPEWHLTEEICRLKSYFDQVAHGCTEDKGTSVPKTPTLGSTGIINDNKTTFRGPNRILIFHGICNDIIEEYVRSGAVTFSSTKDHQGYLSRVDKGFKDAYEAITSPPCTENSEIQARMKQAYEIWQESRRLLCEYKRSPRTMVP